MLKNDRLFGQLEPKLDIQHIPQIRYSIPNTYHILFRNDDVKWNQTLKPTELSSCKVSCTKI